MDEIEGVRQRLHALSLRVPHYENSWYGPLDKFFNVIFSGPNWMVKPQPPFRVETAYAAGPDDSFGSYGNAVERPARFPDFAICQYTPTLTDDTLHIVEVKREDAAYDQACLQLFEYLDSQADVAPDAFGIAIAGSEVGIVTVGGDIVLEFHLDDPQLIVFLKAYSTQHE